MVGPFEHYLDEWEVFPSEIQTLIANSIRKKAILYAGWRVPVDYKETSSMPRSNRYDPNDFADIITRQDVGNDGRDTGRSTCNSTVKQALLIVLSAWLILYWIQYNTELLSDDSNQSSTSTVSHLSIVE